MRQSKLNLVGFVMMLVVATAVPVAPKHNKDDVAASIQPTLVSTSPESSMANHGDRSLARLPSGPLPHSRSRPLTSLLSPSPARSLCASPSMGSLHGLLNTPSLPLRHDGRLRSRSPGLPIAISPPLTYLRPLALNCSPIAAPSPSFRAANAQLDQADAAQAVTKAALLGGGQTVRACDPLRRWPHEPSPRPHNALSALRCTRRERT